MRLLAFAVLASLAVSAASCMYDFDAYEPAAGSSTKVDSGVAQDTGGSFCPGKVTNGRCYYATPLPLRWSDAKVSCELGGGTLAVVTSGVEEIAVEAAGSGDRWIGLSRAPGSPSRADSFKWITGEAGTYLKWGPGQPAGAGECAYVRAGGGWADTNCAATMIAVCEK